MKKYTIWRYSKVNSVQEAYAKCFAVHILKIEILQITWNKRNKQHQTLSFQFLTNRFNILMFFVLFFHVVCKISNSNLWTAKHLAHASCTELTLLWHYDSFPDFTPSSDANWCLTDSQLWEIQAKTWVFTLSVYFEKGGKIWISKLQLELNWTKLEIGLNLKLELIYEIEFAFKLEIFEVFFKKYD